MDAIRPARLANQANLGQTGKKTVKEGEAQQPKGVAGPLTDGQRAASAPAAPASPKADPAGLMATQDSFDKPKLPGTAQPQAAGPEKFQTGVMALPDSFDKPATASSAKSQSNGPDKFETGVMALPDSFDRPAVPAARPQTTSPDGLKTSAMAASDSFVGSAPPPSAKLQTSAPDSLRTGVSAPLESSAKQTAPSTVATRGDSPAAVAPGMRSSPDAIATPAQPASAKAQGATAEKPPQRLDSPSSSLSEFQGQSPSLALDNELDGLSFEGWGVGQGAPAGMGPAQAAPMMPKGGTQATPATAAHHPAQAQPASTPAPDTPSSAKPAQPAMTAASPAQPAAIPASPAQPAMTAAKPAQPATTSATVAPHATTAAASPQPSAVAAKPGLAGAIKEVAATDRPISGAVGALTGDALSESTAHAPAAPAGFAPSGKAAQPLTTNAPFPSSEHPRSQTGAEPVKQQPAPQLEGKAPAVETPKGTTAIDLQSGAPPAGKATSSQAAAGQPVIGRGDPAHKFGIPAAHPDGTVFTPGAAGMPVPGLGGAVSAGVVTALNLAPPMQPTAQAPFRATGWHRDSGRMPEIKSESGQRQPSITSRGPAGGSPQGVPKNTLPRESAAQFMKNLGVGSQLAQTLWLQAFGQTAGLDPSSPGKLVGDKMHKALEQVPASLINALPSETAPYVLGAAIRQVPLQSLPRSVQRDFLQFAQGILQPNGLWPKGLEIPARGGGKVMKEALATVRDNLGLKPGARLDAQLLQVLAFIKDSSWTGSVLGQLGLSKGKDLLNLISNLPLQPHHLAQHPGVSQLLSQFAAQTQPLAAGQSQTGVATLLDSAKAFQRLIGQPATGWLDSGTLKSLARLADPVIAQFVADPLSAKHPVLPHILLAPEAMSLEKVPATAVNDLIRAAGLIFAPAAGPIQSFPSLAQGLSLMLPQGQEQGFVRQIAQMVTQQREVAREISGANWQGPGANWLQHNIDGAVRLSPAQLDQLQIETTLDMARALLTGQIQAPLAVADPSIQPFEMTLAQEIQSFQQQTVSVPHPQVSGDIASEGSTRPATASQPPVESAETRHKPHVDSRSDLLPISGERGFDGGGRIAWKLVPATDLAAAISAAQELLTAAELDVPVSRAVPQPVELPGASWPPAVMRAPAGPVDELKPGDLLMYGNGQQLGLILGRPRGGAEAESLFAFHIAGFFSQSPDFKERTALPGGYGAVVFYEAPVSKPYQIHQPAGSQEEGSREHSQQDQEGQRRDQQRQQGE